MPARSSSLKGMAGFSLSESRDPEDSLSRVGEHASPPVTRWSLVARAGKAEDPGRREALAELVTRYSPAMRAHLLVRKRVSPDDVNDLLQGFIASKLLEKNLVGHADETRGKFRSFLLTAFDNYVTSVAREQSTAKRSPAGGKAVLRIDEGLDVDSAGAGADPFDVVWARQVVREAITRMRYECEASGRSDLWALFDARVAAVLTENRDPVPYEELIARLGFQSPAQATNALATAKRMFRRMLRGVIGDYARDDVEIDEELADLKRVLTESLV
jgi:RNA polymerase sigma-70 factor (ECF subfamily)